MGFRFRKSIKLGPGLRVNVGKRGVGASVGVRGARYSVHSSGRRTTTVGVPGTGVSHSSSRGGGRRRSGTGRAGAAQTQTAPAAPAAPTFPKAGLFAPKHEKEFAKALEQIASGNPDKALSHFRAASERDTTDRAVSDEFFAGILSIQTGKAQDAIPYLERVVASDVELPDELMQKYRLGGVLELGITERVTAEVPWGSLAAALALVECYQETGRTEEAIGVLQQLAEEAPEPALVLSLCELYASEGAWDEIADLAGGTQNEDDITLEIRLLQARALRELGVSDAALGVYKDALRSKKRSLELLKEARYERGRLLLDVGKTSQGMKDLSAVYADDPSYRDVSELVRGPS